MTVSLVQHESAITGMWKLRTGGGGPVSGVVEATGTRLRLTLENTSPECPGKFEGWAELKQAALVGAYHGTDCEGAVSDGWLDLQAR